jgi:glycosyltransferase 2 family protein
VTDTTKRLLRHGAQLVLVALVGWYVARELGGQWSDFRREAGALRPAWGLLIASGVVVFATYALLIDAWRRLAAGGGVRIRYGRAARIWLVSNLGKFLPGRVWQIGAMGALAQQEGVSPGVAAAAAILNALVNLAAGFAILAMSGAGVIPVVLPGGERVALLFAALSGVGLLLLPVLLPWALRLVGRRTGRETRIAIAPGALWFSIASNLAAWLLYGLAFHLFTFAVVRRVPGPWTASVAVFTASYLLGYLALFVPGGLGVREVTMAAALTGLHMTTRVEATLLAVASRLWLTVLEVLPGALLLLRDAVSRPSRPKT